MRWPSSEVFPNLYRRGLFCHSPKTVKTKKRAYAYYFLLPQKYYVHSTITVLHAHLFFVTLLSYRFLPRYVQYEPYKTTRKYSKIDRPLFSVWISNDVEILVYSSSHSGFCCVSVVARKLPFLFLALAITNRTAHLVRRLSEYRTTSHPNHLPLCNYD